MVILMLVGPVDSTTCDHLENQIKKVLKRSVTTLVLDMAGVDLITSRGISTIAKTRASLSQRGGDLAIINVQPQIRRAFEIVCLLPELNVFSDREELDEYLSKVQRKIVETKAES
jgi:anti-anti-sigma factor